MNSYKEITKKYLLKNKKRSLLTIIGIILAVSLFSGIFTFMFSMQDAVIEQKKTQLGDWEVAYHNLDNKEVDKLGKNFEILDCGIRIKSKISKIYNNDNKIDLEINDEKIFNTVFKPNLLEGSIPKKSDEIILERRAKKKLNKNVGDYLNLQEKDNLKKYKIVGFYEVSLNVNTNIIGAMTYFNSLELNSNEKYSVFTHLKEKKNKVDVGTKIGKEMGFKIDPQEQCETGLVRFNKGLLDVMMKSSNKQFNKSALGFLTVLIVIIVICTIAVIYNSFNISIAERIQQFGILRSIGATPSKIRKLVLREAFIMSSIAIPIGVILGYLGIYITIYFLKKFKFFIFKEFFKVKFYPQIILICIILTIITIILSVMGPAFKASRISPINAIRNSENLKKEKYKKRKTFIIKLIFGVEGDIAYKNIRRNNKRFFITIFSLIISLTLFDVFSISISNFKKESNELLQEINFDGVINFKDKNIGKEFIEDIKSREEIDKVYIPVQKQGSVYIEDKFINKEYYNKSSMSFPYCFKISNTNYVVLPNVLYSRYDKNSLEEAKKYLISGKIDEIALNNNGVLLIHRNKHINKNNQIIVDDLLKYKVGDEIKIPKVKHPFTQFNKEKGIISYNIDKESNIAIKNNQFIKVKVIGILSKDVFDTNVDLSGQNVGLIFSEKVFNEYFGEQTLKGICFKFKDKNSREKITDYLGNKCNDYGLEYMDAYIVSKQLNSIKIQISVFVYGFIAIITIIGIINIINTITIGLLLRKGEFATLSSIGTTKGQLTKMVMLEGILHGIIASIFGTIIAYVLYKIITFNYLSFMSMNIDLPIDIFIIGSVGVILITLIASLIPLRRLKNVSILESIRTKE